MAKNFRSNVYEGGVTVDPTVVPGVPGVIGSILPRNGTAQLWQKFGAPDTAWRQLFGELPPTRVAVIDSVKGNDATGTFGGLSFQTIGAALTAAAAAAPAPSAAAPMQIWIAPGVYNEALSFVSNVYMTSLAGIRGSVELSGVCAWTPGAGINAPQTNDLEILGLDGLVLSQSLTVNGALKIANPSIFRPSQTQFSGLAFTGRAGFTDATQIDACEFGTTIITNGGHDIRDTVFNSSLTFAGAASATVLGLRVDGAVTVQGTATCRANQCTLTTVACADTADFIGAGSRINGAVTVAVNASADIRQSEYDSIGNLIGPGPIDRTNYRFTFGPTAAGANVLVFAALIPLVPDYLSQFYSVAFQSTGPVAASPVLTAKAATGLTFNDVGGITYEITITKE